jgi:hypothetical protein
MPHGTCARACFQLRITCQRELDVKGGSLHLQIYLNSAVRILRIEFSGFTACADRYFSSFDFTVTVEFSISA